MYPDYGGRGIKVCDRWLESFENFYEDMKDGYKKGLTLERLDTNGNYEAKNCTWATRIEQQNNRRNSTKISAFGKLLSAPQWSRETGIHVETIRSRIRMGWEPEKALGCAATRPSWRKPGYKNKDHPLVNA